MFNNKNGSKNTNLFRLPGLDFLLKRMLTVLKNKNLVIPILENSLAFHHMNWLALRHDLPLFLWYPFASLLILKALSVFHLFKVIEFEYSLLLRLLLDPIVNCWIFSSTYRIKNKVVFPKLKISEIKMMNRERFILELFVVSFWLHYN